MTGGGGNVVDRVLQLMKIVLAGHPVNIDRMAMELTCSRRQVYRYIAEMRRHGFHVDIEDQRYSRDR